jgi:tetratricopeptide (TPR) repeat protein
MIQSSAPLKAFARTLAVALTATLLTFAAGSAAEINWHDSYETALEAAEKSGKPVFAFVYLSEQEQQSSGPREEIRIDRPGAARGGQRLNVEQMLEQTLADPEVIAATEKFEAVKLDLVDPATDSARHALKVSPGVDAATETRAAMYPITVFLDSTGKELFRRHGSMQPIGYAAQLGQATRLHERREAVLDNPQDPVKRRELGRAYMELDPTPGDRIHDAAVEHLEAAIRFDPDNEEGANFDARVDLAILQIPEATEQSVEELTELQREDGDGHRALEIQYYAAVAHFVLENYAAARKLLREFETDDRNSPYWDSPWTPQALGLLEHIKQISR